MSVFHIVGILDDTLTAHRPCANACREGDSGAPFGRRRGVPLPKSCHAHHASPPLPSFFVNGCHLAGAPVVGTGASPNCRDSTSRYPLSFYEDLIRLGHRVGNHTQDHAVVDGGQPYIRYQIVMNQLTLDRVIEDGVRLFRPPGNGWTNDSHRAIAGDPYLADVLGPIRHTVPGEGTGNQHDYECLAHGNTGSDCGLDMVALFARDGSTRGVVQLHDHRASLAQTREAVTLTRVLVPSLLALGYVFVPLDAIPGVLGPRRFDEEALGRWTHEFGDTVGWHVARSHWGSLRFADLEGDGRLELCGRGNSGVKCVSTINTSFTRARTRTAAFSNADGYRPASYGATLMFGDLDADGDDDMCARYRDGVYCVVSEGRFGSRMQRTPVRWTADFSDGRGWSRERYWGSLRLVDVNGDSRADLCGRSNAGVVCAPALPGRGFGPLEGWLDDDFGDDDDPTLRQLSYATTLMFGDIDRDGDADVCMRKPDGVHCAPNLGSRFGATRRWSLGRFSDSEGWRASRSNWGSLQLVDVDGDDAADLCGRAVTGVVCAFSNGTEFRPYQHLTNSELSDASGLAPSRFGSTLLLGRLDRDRIADVCLRRRDGVWCTHGSDAIADR